MPAAVQKGLRLLSCILYFAALVLHVVFVIYLGRKHQLRDATWQTWASLIVLFALFSIYWNAVRAVDSFNKWSRTIFIATVLGFLLYLAASHISNGITYGESYYDCTGYTGAMNAECAVDRAWPTMAIVAAVFTCIEIVCTFKRGPLGPIYPEVKPENIITTITPAHHSYDIQPNMISSFGEPQSHLNQVEQQQQTLYEQSIFPNCNSSYHLTPPTVATFATTATIASAATSANDTISAVLLQNLPQRQSTCKHEEPNQPQAASQQEEQQQQQSDQPPHPYSPRAFSQPLPIVSNVPPSGTLPGSSTRRVFFASSPIPPISASLLSPNSSEHARRASSDNQQRHYLQTSSSPLTAATANVTEAGWSSPISTQELDPPPPYYQPSHNPQER